MLPPLPTCHPRFYLDDGTVFFQVEHKIYKVHRYFFERGSSIFRSMFSPPPGGLVEGLTHGRPIVLLGVKPDEFDTLLCIFYPLDLAHPHDELNTSQWTALLGLADKWDFSALYSLACARLSAPGILSAAEKIVLGRRFDIIPWLLSGYKELCQRHDVLTLEEGRMLGLEDVVALANVRQQIRQEALNQPLERITELVRKTFAVARDGHPSVYKLF